MRPGDTSDVKHRARSSATSVRGLLIVASLVAADGCAAERRAGATVVEFWAMGREGEVVQQLMPEFERRHPGRARAGAADPVERGAREAADGLRRRRHARRLPGSATPGCRSSSRSARSSRSTTRLAHRRRSRARRLLRRHPRRQRHRRRAPTACRGTSTRGCSSTARDLLRGAGYQRAAGDWDDLARRDGARQAARGAERLRHPAAGERVAAAGDPRAAARRRRCCATATATATSRAPRSATPSRFYLDLFRRGLAPRAGDGAGREPLPGLRRAASSPSTSAGRGTSASSAAACRRRWPGAGRRRRCRRPTATTPASRSPAAPASPSCRSSPRTRRRLAADRVSRRAGAADRVLPPDRRPAGAPQRVGGRRRWRDEPLRAGVLDAARSTCARRRRSRSGSASPARSPTTPRRPSAARVTRRRGARGARPRRRRHAREAALDARPRADVAGRRAPRARRDDARAPERSRRRRRGAMTPVDERRRARGVLVRRAGARR